MNKKLKKIKNRLVSTIQGNYSLVEEQERNKSSTNNYKLKTLITQKIESNNSSKVYPKSKRIYINNINNLTQNQTITQNDTEKDDNLRSINSEMRQRYMARVKSSNGGTIQYNSLANQRSIRHTSKLNKIIKNINEVQFQSELYWNGSSSYLVTGVKNQYEKIKKNYEEKCIEIEKIKREFQVDQIKQLKIYIDKLEKENTKLIEACEKFRNKLNRLKELNSHLPDFVLEKFQSKGNTDVIENELNEIYERYEKLQKKVGNLQSKNLMLSKENKNLVTKVFLQEKIIIERENKQFKLNSLCKKLEKELTEVKENLKKNQEKSKLFEENSESKLLEIKMTMKEQYLLEKKGLNEKLREKETKIDKMEKEFAHMKSLIQSWKHQHENQPEAIDLEENKTEKQRGQSLSRQQSSKSNLGSIKASREKGKIKFNDQTQNTNSIPSNTNNVASQRSLNKSSLKSRVDIGKIIEQVTEKTARHERVTAMTHKQGSVRCRPVQLNDVQRIIEYLKLKLGFNRIEPSQLIQYFDYNSVAQENFSLSKIDKIQDKPNQIGNAQPLWEQEYITLKQVYDVFLKVPFQIKESQAHLLSRFIIEDVKEPYVYMNWDSENSRRMTKSIIANLLNFDTLDEQTIQMSEDLLNKYETVLIPALKSVSKTGYISKEKFIEILNGLGLERTKSMDDYIIGKMCCSSTGLDALNFLSLYTSNN